ncbi:cytochrome P450 CYP72A616-like [Cryptomeria japonica]|uniref:cytochrome P450 CYP72A616-like n=1 Tax=Cryptomeria japonica TaxID=3369 RepID=UPI0027D9E587|nr:cytochrome P450 CYP72A616-like [Cryptomeria japonica]
MTDCKSYGQDFIFWFGPNVRLVVPHPEIIKEILSTKFGNYPKPPTDPLARQLLGKGLVDLKGEKWAQHRKIINPAFHMDRLKGMIPTIVRSGANMLDGWSKLILSGASEIDVQKEFNDLTADVISRTAFGSSFTEGKHIFEMQNKQMILVVDSFRSVYIPGFRFLPTAKNRQRWNVEKEIRRSLRQIIDGRERTDITEKSGRYGADLLGFMMSESKEQGRVDVKSNGSLSTEEIIDELKTFYFAGHESTSVLLQWTIILLGIHQDWQERGHREVIEVCGKNNYPDADSLSRLKTVGMIVNEVLRLYPPAVHILRMAHEPMKLGRLSIPAGTQLEIPMILLCGETMPMISTQGDLMKELQRLQSIQLVLAMILQKFSFATSPSYTHAPSLLPILKPQYGAQLIFCME